MEQECFPREVAQGRLRRRLLRLGHPLRLTQAESHQMRPSWLAVGFLFRPSAVRTDRRPCATSCGPQDLHSGLQSAERQHIPTRQRAAARTPEASAGEPWHRPWRGSITRHSMPQECYRTSILPSPTRPWHEPSLPTNSNVHRDFYCVRGAGNGSSGCGGATAWKRLGPVQRPIPA